MSDTYGRKLTETRLDSLPDHSTDSTPHIPGEAGMWVLILGDMSLFAIYFAVYLVHRIHAPVLFRDSQATLHQGLAATNTVVLLASSLFVAAGIRAMRQPLREIAPKLFASAIGCAVTFALIKAIEYYKVVSDHHGASTNSFYLYYFVLTGIHLVHVLIGIPVLTFLWVQSRRDSFSPMRVMLIEGGACWWHMVDLVWMILFPLVYLAR